MAQNSPLPQIEFDSHEYENQKIYLRQLKESADNMQLLFTNVTKCVGSLCSALTELHSGLERLIGVGRLHPALDALSTDYGRLTSSIIGQASPVVTTHSQRLATLQTFIGLVETECVDSMRSLLSEVALLEKAKAHRRVAVETYSFHKKDYDHKVADYAKKGKPLEESKTYVLLKQSVQEAATSYSQQVSNFSQGIAKLQEKKDVVTAHAIQCFLEHMAGFTGVLHGGFHRMFQRTQLSPPQALSPSKCLKSVDFL